MVVARLRELEARMTCPDCEQVPLPDDEDESRSRRWDMANPCAGRRWQETTAPYRAACAQAAAPCAICGDPIDYTLTGNNKRAFTVDHIIARMHGGPDLDPRNWQPAHRSCNSSRGARENAARRPRRPQPPHFTATRAAW